MTCIVKLENDLSVPALAKLPIVWESAITDPDALWNGSTKIIIKETKVYDLVAQALWQSNLTAFNADVGSIIEVFKNGQLIAFDGAVHITAQPHGSNAATTILLQAGDEVTVSAWNNLSGSPGLLGLSTAGRVNTYFGIGESPRAGRRRTNPDLWGFGMGLPRSQRIERTTISRGQLLESMAGVSLAVAYRPTSHGESNTSGDFKYDTTDFEEGTLTFSTPSTLEMTDAGVYIFDALCGINFISFTGGGYFRILATFPVAAGGGSMTIAHRNFGQFFGSLGAPFAGNPQFYPLSGIVSLPAGVTAVCQWVKNNNINTTDLQPGSSFSAALSL